MRIPVLARIVFGWAIAFAASAAFADRPPGAPPAAVFATVDEARSLLTTRDEFVERLGDFDRRARVGRDGPVTTEDYLAFVAANVRDWPANEQAAVQDAFATIRPRLEALALPWPPAVTFIHTTGSEEGGAAYTRGEAIVLPPAVLAPAGRPGLARILAHELFHVLTRDNPALRTRVYAAIGFVPCGEVRLPAPLRERRITNPDAPRNDHCIAVDVDGSRAYAVPVIYARAPYDATRTAPFFDYLELRLQVVQRASTLASTYDEPQPRLLELREVKGFFEQVGRNTRYVIHPEEILADNFALIVTQAKDVASPDVLGRIEAALRAPDARPAAR